MTSDVKNEPASRTQRVLVMATVIMASSMYVTDLVVIAMALPHMQGTFSATPVQISWVATAFVLGSTTMIIAIGWISARVGVRRLFAISIICFMVLAVLAANARSLEQEIIWRLLMGMSGAPVQSLAQVILLNTYPREQSGRALALWGSGVMIAPICALPVGGFVIGLFGWPGVFYMYLPTGALALFGIFFFVPKAQIEKRRELDWFGLATLIFAIAWLQYALSRGAREDWFESTEIVIAVLVASFSAYLFVVHSLTTKNPLVPAAMFRNRNFALATTGGFIFGAATTPLSLLLALMLQNQLNYPVELIGFILVPRAIGILISQYAVAFLILHIDPRRLMIGGALTCSLATWIMSGWSLDVSPWQVAWTILLHGIGDGFIWMSLNPLAFSTLEARHRTQAVPLYYLSFNVGLSLGIASIMTYWAHSSQANHALLAEFITPFNELIRGDRLPNDVAAAATMAGEISRQAAMIAYNNCFVVMTVGVLFIVPVAYLIRNPGWRPESREP